jgi:hypothetical protein
VLSVTSDWDPSMSSDDRVIALEAAVEDVFTVQDVATRRHGEEVVLTGQFLRSPELVFDTIRARFLAQGFVPLLRQDGGRDLVIASPAPDVGGPLRVRTNVVLFLATVVSVVLAGTLQHIMAQPLPPTGGTLRAVLEQWRTGVPFAAALLGILGIHELGHYFTARRYGLDVTPPYFIPFPINIWLGTLGAVIRIRSPFESRKALFDVGIAGPLAGMVVAVPVLLIGLAQAHLVAVPPDPSQVIVFREPLLFQWLALLVRGPRPTGMDFDMGPLLMAGWWGFILTALNLLPTSQLDGGHISYAFLGTRHRYVAWATVVLLGAAGLYARNPSFLIVAVLVLLMGVEHPPALNDVTPIGTRRRLLGVVALILLVLVVTPDPFGGAL